MTFVAPEPTVDVNVPRFNQALVALFTASGFVFQQAWLVVVTFAVLAISLVAGPRAAPFTQLYVRFVRPRLQPSGPVEFEAAAPPRFAQLIGTVFLGAATFALIAGWEAVGWVLALVVAALASLAATARICVGCLLYERVISR